jgi:hypothetical protein
MTDSGSKLLLGPFFLGIFFILLALAGTYSGEAWARNGQVVSRAEKPKQFWSLVAGYYVGGAGLIGYSLYQVYGLPN